MAAYLPPVEKPRGLLIKIVYFFTRRQFGTVLAPISVFAARMPPGFMSFYGKLPRLDKKLKLPAQTAVLIREQVASVNTCLFCMEASRWYVMKESPESLGRLDALPEYRTSPLFTEAERAALDYATQLTAEKKVEPGTFERLTRYYGEREICDIVWLVASEHLYNMTNIGLNIGAQGLCDLPAGRSAKAAESASTAGKKAPAASR